MREKSLNIILISLLIIGLFNIVSFSYTILWHPTPVLLPGESHGWRSLVGYSPWDHTELDTTEAT